MIKTIFDYEGIWAEEPEMTAIYEEILKERKEIVRR